MQALGCLQAQAHGAVGLFQRALVQGAVHRALQLRHVVGLAHVVVGTTAQCADCGVDGILAADDDHGLVPATLHQPVQHGKAGCVRQAVVEQHEVVVLLLEARNGLAYARRFVEAASGLGEHVRKGATQCRIVIDDQNAKAGLHGLWALRRLERFVARDRHEALRACLKYYLERS